MTFDGLVPGDLVFRVNGETAFGGAVGSVVRGWGDLPVYHVGIYEGAGMVWEAGQAGVRRCPLAGWTGKLLAGRLDPAVQNRVPDLAGRVLAWVRLQEGLPYNDTFLATKKAFYCSELVVDAFRASGLPVFKETPLSFRDPSTGLLVDYWVRYYADRGLEIPEGQAGSHPAHLSLSPELGVEVLGPVSGSPSIGKRSPSTP